MPRILLGSTAEQVVRFARCSVLVARHPPDQLPPSPAQRPAKITSGGAHARQHKEESFWKKLGLLRRGLLIW